MTIDRAVQNEIKECACIQKILHPADDASSGSADLQCLPIFHDEDYHRSKRMPIKKLYRHIELGYGQGHGSHYQPWLRIQRRNASPKSNQVVAWLPPLGREAHFFSRGEYHTALLLLWLQVQDIREQYPLWPVEHPHPLLGAENVDKSTLPWSKGLIAIAREAGIDHGTEIGAKLPYVATMDLAVTVKIQSEAKLFTFSSKPIADPSDEVKWRTLERLELERRYAEEVGAKHVITTSALVPIRTAGYLEWWLDGAGLGQRGELLSHALAFADKIERHSENLPMAEAVRAAAESLALSLDQAWLLFRHCAWTQKIDIDPTRPLLTTYPIQSGGRALRSAIKRQLFAEKA